MISSEFQTPSALPLANLAWEDGVYISRDGLNLYAHYAPMDWFSAIGQTPDQFYRYERGKLIGQDFRNPLAQPTPWIHADIAYAHRTSTSQTFACWTLSGIAGLYYSQGAVTGILNGSNPSLFDFFLYSDANSSYGKAKIKMLKSIGLNPQNQGLSLPDNVNENNVTVDNPHLERTSDNNLVLFYETTDKPGGPGGNDMLYTTSADSGVTWSTPAFVTSLNTAGNEMQPHLYHDGTKWWLYYAATNPND